MNPTSAGMFRRLHEVYPGGLHYPADCEWFHAKVEHLVDEGAVERIDADLMPGGDAVGYVLSDEEYERQAKMARERTPTAYLN
jgi:hypothetical protein